MRKYNIQNLKPAQPGERRAAKPEALHAKNRTLRFSDAEWAELQAHAKAESCGVAEYIRRELL